MKFPTRRLAGDAVIPTNAIEDMINLGKADAKGYSALLPGMAKHENHFHPWWGWKEAAASLSDEDFGLLILGLAIAEAAMRWPGGSVAPAGCLYRFLAARNKEIGEATAEVVSRVWSTMPFSNCYAPFDSVVKDARAARERATALQAVRDSISERETTLINYWGELEWLVRKQKWISQETCHIEDGRLIELASQAKKENEQRIEERTTFLFEQVDALQKEVHRLRTYIRNVRREKVIEAATKLEPTERFRLIVKDKEFEIDAFPEEWTQIDDATLRKVDKDVAQSLIAMLETRQKRAWAKLRDRLLKMAGS